MRTIALLLLLATPAAGQVTGYADYLYWQANSSGFQLPEGSQPVDELTWNSGFRAGLGLKYHNWWASWNYTLYGSKSSDYQFDSYYDGMDWLNEDYYWESQDLDYQVHDLEFARSFQFDSPLELTVFGGFRWGQINYSTFKSRQHYYALFGHDHVSDGDIEDLWNDSEMDSYGVRIGGEFDCLLTERISIFGRGAFSGLVSTTTHTATMHLGIYPSGLFPPHITTWRDTHENTCIEASVGVKWTYRCLQLIAGYEWSVWDNAIQTDAYGPFDYRALVLDGLFARAALTF